MALDSFSPVASTIEHKKMRTVLAIRSILEFGAAHLLHSYRSIQRLVNDNPDGIRTADLLGMLDEELPSLRELACLTKTICNRLHPGLIVDAVPMATFVLPGKSYAPAGAPDPVSFLVRESPQPKR